MIPEMEFIQSNQFLISSLLVLFIGEKQMAFLLWQKDINTDQFEEIAQRDDIEDLVSVAEHHIGVKPLIWENCEDGIVGKVSHHSDDQYLITSN